MIALQARRRRATKCWPERRRLRLSEISHLKGEKRVALWSVLKNRVGTPAPHGRRWPPSYKPAALSSLARRGSLLIWFTHPEMGHAGPPRSAVRSLRTTRRPQRVPHRRPLRFWAHLCIGGWRPYGKNFFDVAATFGRGAVIGPASSKRIPCPRALMVVRGSDPSHYVALDAHAQVRALPILGLDRLPLRRRRSHRFDSLLRQLIYPPSGDGGCRLAECFATAHHRPSDPGHLVGHRDRDHARWTPLEE